VTKAVYLYGTDLKGYSDTPYADMLLTKINMGQLLLDTLVRNESMEDYRRINDVVKATKFNRELLYELGFDDPAIATKLKEHNGF